MKCKGDENLSLFANQILKRDVQQIKNRTSVPMWKDSRKEFQ